MPGQGKYTVYAPPAGDRNERLSKLFKGNEAHANPYVDLVGKEEDARKQVVDRAKEYLTPVKQPSIRGTFPEGVNMDYVGAPDTTEGVDVKWQKAGDPANSFAPDQRSPGPGNLDAASAENLQSDPETTVSDIKGPGYVQGGPGTGTQSPALTAQSAGTYELGNELPMGKSAATAAASGG